MRAFYSNLPMLELLKSLNTKKYVDRIPDIDDIAGTLKHSFQAMLESKPFGKLVGSTDLKNLEQDDFNINYVLWHAMMKDLELSSRQHFFFPPYDATLMNDETANDESVKKKKSRDDNDQDAVESMSLSSLMGVTSADRARVHTADSTTQSSVKGKGKSIIEKNVLGSSNIQEGGMNTSLNLSTPKSAKNSSQKLPIVSTGTIRSRANNRTGNKSSVSLKGNKDKMYYDIESYYDI